MLILELASNITLRLFLRPFEAVLSLKSLFERVPEGLQGSYFVWRAKMRNYYHLESSLEAVRPILKSEAARGRSSDLEPPRPPYMILKWLALTSGCQIWPRGGSRSLEQPRAASDLKSGRMASRLDPHIWYSNDLSWPQDVKFDLDLGWPRRPRVTSEVQNRGRGQIWHPKVIWVESWVVLTWYFWGKPKILFSPNLSPTV